MTLKSNRHASCAILLIVARRTGPTMCNATAPIIVTMITADVDTPSFAMLADAMTTSATTKRVSLGRKMRTFLSPVLSEEHSKDKKLRVVLPL